MIFLKHSWLWFTKQSAVVIASNCSIILSNIRKVEFHLVDTSCISLCSGCCSWRWTSLYFSEDFTLLWKCDTMSLHRCWVVFNSLFLVIDPWTTRFRECAKHGRCCHGVLLMAATILLALSVTMQIILLSMFHCVMTRRSSDDILSAVCSLLKSKVSKLFTFFLICFHLLNTMSLRHDCLSNDPLKKADIYAKNRKFLATVVFAICIYMLFGVNSTWTYFSN